MPVGTNAIQSQNVPSEAFIVNPDEFFGMTVRNIATIENQAAGSSVFPGMEWSKQLPQTGIISELEIVFTGTLTVSTADVVTTPGWPYNILDSVAVSVNGQNNLWSVNGVDLQALRFARNPAYEDATDVIPGGVGVQTIADQVSAYPISVTWQIPVAMDPTSLVGALYAQSGATTIALNRRVATNAQLFSTNPANAVIDGEFTTSITRFTVPRSNTEGNPLVIPDLSRLHQVTAVELPITSTGDSRLEIPRSNGSLARLFFSGDSAANTPLKFTPSAAAANKVDALRLEYGNAQRPYSWDPASLLVSQNNRYYGAPLPYNRVCIDLVRENAPRDMILLQGVTDLALIPTVNSAVSLSGGKGRLVSETLF